MAARHFSFKTGKVGAGAKHAEYIAGVGKYARDDVCHLSDHNLPEWADDGRDFFVAADANERMNGRSYSEIEFAIPREAADPVAYALHYANNLLGNRHAYRLAVHDKLAADGGQNIHGHLMFSERHLDGIARGRELFFRRANTKHPERGGAAKDRAWNDRQHIDRLRRGYEAHALAYGIPLNLRSNDAQGLGATEPKIGPQHRSKGDLWRDDNLAQVKTLRQRRRRVRVLQDEIASTKREIRDFRRERARQDANACQDADLRGNCPHRSPLGSMRAETRRGRTLYRWTHGAAAGLPAISDRGDQLNLVGKASKQKARALVELAKHKGWQSLVLTGSDEFKRLAVREALREGLKVANPELAEIVKQLQETTHEYSQQQHARRAFAAWRNRTDNHPGLRVSRRAGPERMPTLRQSRPGDGYPEAGHPVLQGTLSRPGGADHGVHRVCSGGALMSRQTGEQARDQSAVARIDLARRWLATAAPVDALEAAALQNDPDRLLSLFNRLPEAQRWDLIQRQRADGVPEPLLGFRIERNPEGVTEGTVRYVGKQAWVEPKDRPGVVVPLTPTQSLRSGQQIAIQSDGELIVLPEPKNTPRPR